MAARSTTQGTPVKSCSRDARRHKADFLSIRALSASYRLDIGGRDALAVFIAQKVFEQNLNGKRKAIHRSEALPGE